MQSTKQFKIVVAASLQAGSLYANAINTIKMAEGFARLGHEVVLICREPKDKPIQVDTFYDLYGITTPFKVVQLSNSLGDHWKFAFSAIRVVKKEKPDFIYARNYVLPAFSSYCGFHTVMETHAAVNFRSLPFLFAIKMAKRKSFLGITTISESLSDYYQTLGVPSQKIRVYPDSVDTDMFNKPEQLPPTPYQTEKPNIVYVGHLYDYKGIPTILQAAKMLPEYQFHLIGGWPEDVQRQQNQVNSLQLENVILYGLQGYSKTPLFMWHSDVLLLVPSANHPSARWTSPVKLGEYLSSQSPVVCSEIPALLDWLTEESVWFVKPDDPESLKQGINQALNDPNKNQKIEKGFLISQEWSYQNRAQNILDYFFIS